MEVERWGCGFALGLDLEYEAAFDGGGEYAFEIEPRGGVHYRSGNNLFFLEGKELGWRGRVNDHWLLQAGTRHEDGLDPDASAPSEITWATRDATCNIIAPI